MKPRPIRVAILCYRDDAISGGSLRVAEVIANNLNPARVEAHLVFAYGGPGPVTRRSSVPCHYLEGHGPRDIKAWGRARKTMRTIKPDVIHFIDNIVWLQLALLGSGYKRIVHVHGSFLPSDIRRSTKLIWQFTNRAAKHVVCISRGARDNLVQLGLSTREHCSVVYNSVNCRDFENMPTKKQVRASLNLPQDALLLGIVCRLVRNKGCIDFLSLIERLPSQWQGVICGDGPQRAELELRCRELNLDARVHFLGLQDDVVSVYAALNAYAFLSRYEAFGLILAEAMVAGIPVFGFVGDGEYREPQYPLITSETSAFVEHRRPYENSEPATPDALDSLASLIINYGDHPDEYRRMIERARAWVQCCFDAPLQAEAMTCVYEGVNASTTLVATRLETLYERARSEAVNRMAIFDAPSPKAMTEVA